MLLPKTANAAAMLFLFGVILYAERTVQNITRQCIHSAMHYSEQETVQNSAELPTEQYASWQASSDRVADA